jgi:hypothetical protein
MEVTTEQHVAQTSFSVKSPITIETDVVHVDTGAAGLSQGIVYIHHVLHSQLNCISNSNRHSV